MKKLLALVLAMVMTLGLATVGTNAVDKFADADSIKFTEAATVMKAIGVFDGDENGNFRPTETLKRSEAAKIVAYLMLTKKTADNLIPSGTRYVDVPSNHWAAGYIEYLTSEGVLGGVGNGMFNPDGDITGVDFAKMLLVALGYDAKLENLVLSDYRINTAKLANSIDLFEGNTDMVPTAAITRDEAVLYAFNMIKSPMVEYDSNVRVETGSGGVVTVGNNRAYQKTSSNYTKQTVSLKEAARNDTLNTNASAQYLVEFAEEKYTDLELVGRDVTADTFGRPARKWLYKNVDLGTYVQTKDLVTTWNKKVTAKIVYDELGKTIYDSLKDGYSYLDSWVDGAPTVVDSFTVSGNTVTNTRFTLSNFMDRDNTTKVNGSGNGTVTELYMDKDKNVTVVTMNVYVYQASADYNKSSKTLRITPAGETEYTGHRLNSNELKLEDFADIENYKTDDYLLAKAAWNGTNYEIKEIEKAEVLSGKVDAYTTSGTYNVTIDGTKHDYAVTAESASDETRKTMYSVGKDAKVVVDKNGYIYAVDEAIVTSDYVFITKFGSNSNLNADAVAAAYFTDGTDSTIKVKSVYNFSTKEQTTSKSTIASWTEGTTGATRQANQWYTYSKNASGEYTLYAPQSGRSLVSHSYNYDVTDLYYRNAVLYDGQVMFMRGEEQVRADDKTIVVVNDDAKSQINVYTGVKNVPGISLTSAGASANVYTLVKTSDNVATVVYVALKGDALVTGSANDNLVYVIKSDGAVRANDDKNETRWQYKVLKNDGTTDTETIVADNQIADYTNKYMIANYASKNADGVYTRFYKVSNDMAQSDTVAWGLADGTDWRFDQPAMDKTYAPISYKNGALQIGGYGWTLDSDAKITVVGVKPSGSTNAINTDKAADEEIHAWISGSELNGMFNNLSSYTYDYALRTTGTLESYGLSNSGRSTVKELFVTVWTAVESTAGSSTAQTTANVVSTGSTNMNTASGSDTYVNVSYAAPITDARYVPAQGRLYFTLQGTVGANVEKYSNIQVSDGYSTTNYTGNLYATNGQVYYIDYSADSYYNGYSMSLSASAEGEVSSWKVTPMVSINGGSAVPVKNSSGNNVSVVIDNEEDATFTVTLLKSQTGITTSTWIAYGDDEGVVTFDESDLTVTGTSVTLSGKLDAKQASAPSITLYAFDGGYNVSFSNLSSVSSLYRSDNIGTMSWAETRVGSVDGKAENKLNITLNETVKGDEMTVTVTGTLTDSKGETRDIEAGDYTSVVGSTTATVTFDFDIKSDSVVTLDSVWVLPTADTTNP